MSERLTRKYEKLARLCRELDAEMDGVACPASAAAILNAIRSVLQDVDGELEEMAANHDGRWDDLQTTRVT